ncbi:efflux RND transporter periplasmic adaptor subunit [Nguyenibacter sp. L1]|uniref:efflux RND transporter periplasmic adaptor subunit n=1 Tax=Nguyenibacter sp. L1 TaxID=3049350 RepID=UPI002B48A78B|nr:efflux RND transporter periplasmic adaptor subunit [Nguyenibacter sp. L1]WRH89442.1 efflux RND transporter periplasmic adaptor subunit [Nguyenibacter sp. L1]
MSDMSASPGAPAAQPSRPKLPRLAGPAIGLGVLAALGYGAIAHARRDAATRDLAAYRQSLLPEVRTMRVAASAAPVPLDLPGATEPLETAAIGARASGYVAQRLVDIGTHVQAGQVLAVIHAPEIDQQVQHARAALAQAQADLDLARATAGRSARLIGDGAVSRQNWDTDQLTQKARLAQQQAALAALAEATQHQAYMTLTAPFDGVVTARTVEVGDLVGADGAGQRPLFVVARTDRLRVRVRVPQDWAASIALGMAASVGIPNRPHLVLTGTVARTGHALEAGSRTLPVEIELDNADGRLAAGLYATVRFAVPRPLPVVLIPAEALIFDADGLSVATVDADRRVTLRPVSVGRDYGDRVEITGGLPDGSRLVVNPPSALRTGSQVIPHSDDMKGA